MIESYYRWHSPFIGGREFQMMVFGDRGLPVILFPTSMGTYYESKDHGLIDSVRPLVEEGIVRICCPDSIDAESWYNKRAHPSIRAYNHTCYERLILEEVLERVGGETDHFRIAVAGCGFGGYHAADFAFRHPHKVGYLFTMSGLFDIRPRLDGYYDDNVYHHNPVEYLVKDKDPYLWKMTIILGVAGNDICLDENKNLSRLLDEKEIDHRLDIRPGAVHDWPSWREMFSSYLSLLRTDEPLTLRR